MNVNEEQLHDFFRTMYERQEMWWYKTMSNDPHPWSQDKILSEYKFCNVYRELDRNTQWLLKNVIKPKHMRLRDKVWQIMVFRLFNVPKMFEDVGMPTIDVYSNNGFEWVKSLKDYEQDGGKIRNAEAYNINTWISKGRTEGMACAEVIMPSAWTILNQIFDIKEHDQYNYFGDPQALVKKFKEIEGIGDFVSHEWFIDICYIADYAKSDTIYKGFTFNRNDFTSIGPGATGGLQEIFEKPYRKMDALKALLDLSEDYLKEFGDFRYVGWDKDKQWYGKSSHNLKLTDIEFWLCEFFKYCKIGRGKTFKRQKFVPTTKE